MNSAYGIAQLREENQNDAIKMYQQRIEHLKKRNDELKQKHNGLQEDFKYNLQLVRERDDELDRLEKEIEKKNEVIMSLSKSLQNYKEKVQSEKALNTKNQQLLSKSKEDLEIAQKEQQIKLNDLKFEFSQKTESAEKQNVQQTVQIQQLRELVERLKSQNETGKASNQSMASKYEAKLDELVAKLSTVSAAFDKEKKANKARIDEYIKSVRQKNEHCLKLEQKINDLTQKLSARQSEYNELYFGCKERDKQLAALKVELSNSCSQRAEKETVLSGRDTKILRLEHDLQKMYENQFSMNSEKKELGDKLLRSNQEIERLNQKIQILSEQLLSSQHSTSSITTELAQSNERLKADNDSLKRQNAEIRNVTNEMKEAITQLHELSAIDKQHCGVNAHEMQSLLDENEKLKKELHSIRGRLKERERELAMLKREKSRLHEISNRYHHQLTLREFDPSPTENAAEHALGADDQSQSELKLQNERLMRKIKELQSSLSYGDGDSEKSLRLNRSAVTEPLPATRSAKSIRNKYDEVRRKLSSGMNASKSSKSKSGLVRNWNHR